MPMPMSMPMPLPLPLPLPLPTATVITIAAPRRLAAPPPRFKGVVVPHSRERQIDSLNFFLLVAC